MVKILTTFFIINSPQIKYTYYCEGQIAKCQHKWCLPSNYEIQKKSRRDFFGTFLLFVKSAWMRGLAARRIAWQFCDTQKKSRRDFFGHTPPWSPFSTAQAV
jgi:hypothetical protein